MPDNLIPIPQEAWEQIQRATSMPSNMPPANFGLRVVDGVVVPKEPTDKTLWKIMIAGEMDTKEPQLSGLARASAAYHAIQDNEPAEAGPYPTGKTPRTDALEVAVSRGMLGSQPWKEVRRLECELADAISNVEHPAWIADFLNRRAVIEQSLLDVANGKAPLPTKEQCRAWALRLGVPTGYLPNDAEEKKHA